MAVDVELGAAVVPGLQAHFTASYFVSLDQWARGELDGLLRWRHPGGSSMMRQHILVTYASRAGSTAEVAQAIGHVLRQGGAEVDVLPVEQVRSLAGYDALVLGSAIWTGRPLPEALRFAAAQQQALAGLPVAYFALCEILRVDTPTHRDRARGFLDPLRKIRAPVALEVFAGKKNYSSVHPLVRWVMIHVLHSPEGDWRDWDKIRAWAAALPSRLGGERQPAEIDAPLARQLAGAGGRR